jgi:WD40 repeat protein
VSQACLRIDREEASNWRPKSYLEHRQRILTTRPLQRGETYFKWRQFLLQNKQNTMYQQRHHQMLGTLDKYTMAEQTRRQFWLFSDAQVRFQAQHSEEDNTGERGSVSSVDGTDDESLAASLDNDMSDHTNTTIKADNTYKFAGMHNIFIGCDSGEVNRIKFANNISDLIAYATAKNEIIIATTSSVEQKSINVLSGHTAKVHDFDWSVSNDYIISVSADKTIKLWDTSNGKCLRTITEKAEATCVMFHPMNGNIFLAGFTSGVMQAYNLSTGKPMNSILVSKPITAMCMSPQGDLVFIGDSVVCYHF